jgi:TATA-box binding protein (TBP) (component of TFIID and TFIIIB)
MLNDGDGTLNLKEITIKIFQNGVFHMTGILHDKYHESCMRILLQEIWNNSQDSLKDIPEKYEILNYKVVLMNYTTKLSSNQTIAREHLHNTIRKSNMEHITSHYDPDVYPGVKICIGKDNWTAKVFRTGKIILTGITTKEQCLEFVTQLGDLLQTTMPSPSFNKAS